MLRVLWFILVCFTCNNSVAAIVEAPPHPKQKAVLKTDTSNINLRYFDEGALANYSKNPEFQYHDAGRQASLMERLWRGFWSWFWHLFDFLNYDKHSNSVFQVFLLILKYVFVLLGLGAIVFFILKLVGIDLLNLFSRKPLSANLPYSEAIENIHEIDFESEIEKALNQHNYRFAVRMLYLKCLKQLSDAALIKWQPDKTNNVYINELENAEQQIAFKRLTFQFEFVWYGEFAIDSNMFNDINFMFQNFKTEIT